MATTATMVAAVRLELNDEPAKIQLDGALSDTTTETVTVNSGETNRIQVGTRLEHDDGSGEARRVLAITSATVFTAERGYMGSTAATHSDNTYLLIAPIWRYDQITRALTVALAQVYAKGVYDIEVEDLTSSATSNYYNLPDANIEEVLAIYQKPSSFTEPIWLHDFSHYPLDTSTTEYAAGKAIWIRENYGVPGTDVYRLVCKERLTVTTLSAAQEEIVKWLACAELLEGREPRRGAGPTNQGDRTVRVADQGRNALFYRTKAEELIMSEKSNLRSRFPVRRNWIASGSA